MSFGLYSARVAIVIAALLLGAHLMRASAPWISAGGIVLVAVAILSRVKATRQKNHARNID